MISVRVIKNCLSILFVLLILTTCNNKDNKQQQIKIAFMSDVHLQDVYGKFSDSEYKGVLNPLNGEYATIRTMASQLSSTRLFNENYFAFLTALDDVVERGIKMVVLPGDFSDDGQPINVNGLKEILDDYNKKHGISFFMTTGNHDPGRPFINQGGKKDFLGEGGKPQAIMSKEGMFGPDDKDHPPIISKDIAEMGYESIIEVLHDYGFYPQKDFIYWETPFSNYNYQSYCFSEATKQAIFDLRHYQIPPTNFKIPDVSYLVEPSKDLWLLAIDANVYIPIDNPSVDETDPGNYSSASIGYNNVLTHKKHLIGWVQKITKQAQVLNKTLVVFSHYPMIDFHNNASHEIQNLLGKRKMQTHRVPVEDVARIFADAGVKLHFAGHLHVNDTGIRKTAKGNTLVNVQIPSLAAYIPAYKLLTIHNETKMEVETIVIDSVPGFNEFFGLYKQEHDYLKNKGQNNIWNEKVLSAKTYLEFTEWHLKELVRLRFIQSDWSLPFGIRIQQLTGLEMLVLSQMKDKPDLELNEMNPVLEEIKPALWQDAMSKASEAIGESNIPISDFEKWDGKTMLLDFYKLRNADELAFKNIGEHRLKQYQVIAKLFLEDENTSEQNIKIFYQLQEFSKIIDKFLNGNPSFHFLVDLEKGKLTDLKEMP